EAQGAARQPGGFGERQLGERPAKNQVGLAVDEITDCTFRCAAVQEQLVMVGFLLVRGEDITREPKLPLRASLRRDAERSGPVAPAQDGKFRLSKDGEQVWPWRAQADFDHAISHRDDVFDRAQSVLEGIAARRCDRSLEYPRDLLCGNLAAVRPV